MILGVDLQEKLARLEGAAEAATQNARLAQLAADRDAGKPQAQAAQAYAAQKEEEAEFAAEAVRAFVAEAEEISAQY